MVAPGGPFVHNGERIELPRGDFCLRYENQLELKTNAELKAAIDNGMAGIAFWDVSGITDFSGAFNIMDQGRNADLDLRPLEIEDWDVSKGKNFYQMFAGATEFNGAISKWDVSKGRNFDEMFYRAKAFNRNLGDWDVSQGTSFENMFKDADACELEIQCNREDAQDMGTCSTVTCGVCAGNLLFGDTNCGN